jgi:hypothetical protein
MATLVFVLGHAAVRDLTFAGPYAGYVPGDQLRYLGWIREAGLHLLIADPYRAGAPHDYLQPMFLISGLLWRAGLSIQAAYLIWTPVALGVLVWGYARYAGRFLRGGERAAALALGLLFLSPLVPLFDYGGIVDSNGAYYLINVGSHGVAYWQAWGYLPDVIALGLMALILADLDTLLSASALSRRVIWTAAGGLVVAWLHPWGGIELAAIAAALVAVRRLPPGSTAIAIVGLATSLPLIYYAILAGTDPAWSLSQLQGAGNEPLLWPLVFTYGPLLLPALLVARIPRTPREQVLVLWPVAALLLYLVLGEDARTPALEGVSLPLAILAVRGWRRLHAARWVSVAALFLAMVPGAFYSAHTFRDTYHDREVPFALAPGEQSAVDSLEHTAGNVLATPYLAPALPALAGVLDGRSIAGANAFFAGQLDQAQIRRLIAAQRIRFVISDCLPGRADLSTALGPLGFRTERYGCARIYARVA